MATNPSTKKSSIPRATHDCEHPDQAKSKLKGPKPPVPKPSYPHHSRRPAPDDGLLKEDGDAVRRSLLELESDHTRMKQTLEDTVREAEHHTPGGDDAGGCELTGSCVPRSQHPRCATAVLRQLSSWRIGVQPARGRRSLLHGLQPAFGHPSSHVDEEERLAAMEQLMAQREKLCSDNLNAVTEKTETLENQVEDYEKKLMENNIDPVTGEVQEPSEEQTAAVEKVKKVTKGDITKMREKLHQMNENSDKYLVDIQNILKELEDLEGTSQRISNSSQFQGLSSADLKALIGEVEEAQKKEEQQKKKEKNKKEDAGEEEEEENTEEEEDEEYPRQDETENVQLPTKLDVFLTQNLKEHTT